MIAAEDIEEALIYGLAESHLMVRIANRSALPVIQQNIPSLKSGLFIVGARGVWARGYGRL